MGEWTFFSNYGHVLVCLARNPQVRLRDVASEVGITERAVQKIVRDLQDAEFLEVSKQGRRNRYQINKRKGLRHQLESHCTVGKLLALVAATGRKGAPAARDSAPSAPLSGATAGKEPADPEPPAPPQHASAAEAPEIAVQASDSQKEQAKEKEQAAVDTRQQGSLF